jgi:hypothetical protein
MANTSAIATSFLKELLQKVHNIDNAGDTLRAALYLATATLDNTKATYGGTIGSAADTGEVSGSGYSPGGVVVTHGAGCVNSSGKTAFFTPTADIDFGTVTLATSFDCVLLFNVTASNKAILAKTFTAQTVSAANFKLTMPTNDAANALLRITGP